MFYIDDIQHFCLNRPIHHIIVVVGGDIPKVGDFVQRRHSKNSHDRAFSHNDNSRSENTFL